MPKEEAEIDLQAVYATVVSYHNGLVQIRFTVAGLFLAANGFLASGFVEASCPPYPSLLLVPILGMAVASWILEVRNRQLLDNLRCLGRRLETECSVSKDFGFIALMDSLAPKESANRKVIPPRLPFFRREIPQNRVTRYLVSHSFGFDLLYLLIIVLWVLMSPLGG